MVQNFRIKYTFKGKEYSSGVSDIYRDSTVYYIYFPTELRAVERMGPQFLQVTNENGDFKTTLKSPLAQVMFNAFLTYLDKRPI